MSEQPVRYLVVLRAPERGDRYLSTLHWSDDEQRYMTIVAESLGLESVWPVIVTDVSEAKLLTVAIDMRDLLDSIAHADDDLTDALGARFSQEIRDLVRRFDEWEPS